MADPSLTDFGAGALFLSVDGLSRAYTGGLTPGSTLIAVLTTEGSGVTHDSLSDSVNGAWEKIADSGLGGSYDRVSIWVCEDNASSSTPTVTAVITGSSAATRLVLREAKDADTVAPVEDFASAAGNSIGGGLPSAAAATAVDTAGAAVLITGIASIEPPTIGGGFVKDVAGGPNFYSNHGYRVVESGGSYDPAWIFESSLNVIYATATVAIKGGAEEGDPTAAVTGTATEGITEADVVAGGKTIVITLTGDTWITADGGAFDAIRQDIIDGIESAMAEPAGWNAEVRPNLAVTDVARTSDTVVTVTLSAQAAYDITVLEAVTATVPAAAVDGGEEIVAAPSFNVAAVSEGVGGSIFGSSVIKAA